MVKANHALSNSAQSATDLIPVRLLPSPHPGQCCSVLVSNDPTELQHCFFITGRGGGGGGGGGGEALVVASAFKSFILKLNMATSIFCLRL